MAAKKGHKDEVRVMADIADGILRRLAASAMKLLDEDITLDDESENDKLDHLIEQAELALNFCANHCEGEAFDAFCRARVHLPDLTVQGWSEVADCAIYARAICSSAKAASQVWIYGGDYDSCVGRTH